jgi:SAM-dependent methyltransferase
MKCHYVGLPEYVGPAEIFTEYAYFSSTSTSWAEYIRESAEGLIARLGLDGSSQVIEMGSNDGYFLQHFLARGIPAFGVEPAVNVARVANQRGVPTLPAFFNSNTAKDLLSQGKAADLLLAYNCLDHVPDINDVVAGMKLLLKPGGVIQIELPYLGSLVEHREFDTIYHDRFSYFSLHSLKYVFDLCALRIFDVARIPTHGGSLRILVCNRDDARHATDAGVEELLEHEHAIGMLEVRYYEQFAASTHAAKFEVLETLIRLRRTGRSIVGYGVPAKGNVLLNYCGIRNDLLDYLVDRSPYKCGKLAPGSRLEIRNVEEIRITRPDYLLILPWNIKDEILQQMSYVRDWGARFIVPVPQPQIL